MEPAGALSELCHHLAPVAAAARPVRAFRAGSLLVLHVAAEPRLTGDPGAPVDARHDLLIGGETLDRMWWCREHPHLVAWDEAGGDSPAFAAALERDRSERAGAQAAQRAQAARVAAGLCPHLTALLEASGLEPVDGWDTFGYTVILPERPKVPPPEPPVELQVADQRSSGWSLAFFCTAHEQALGWL